MGLRPKRSLLNHNFQGYRLAADISTTLKSCASNVHPLHRKLKDELFSFHLVRVFGTWNHMFTDPWAPEEAFFVADGWKICRCFVTETGPAVEEVLSLPVGEIDDQAQPLPACVFLTSERTAVVSDGKGALHIISTGNRTPGAADNCSWKILASHHDADPWLLLSCVKNSSTDSWDCVSLSFEVLDNTAVDGKSTQQCVFTLSWLKLRVEAGGVVKETHMCLTSSSVPLYCALERNATSLLLMSEGGFTVSGSSGDGQAAIRQPAMTEAEPSSSGIGADEKAMLDWTQTSEDLTVSFKVDGDVRSRDIVFHLERQEIVLGLTDGTSFLRGKLFGAVDREGSTWTLETGQLELSLEKYQPGQQWSSVLVEEESPKLGGFAPRPLENLTEEQMKAIRDRLEQFTSDELVSESELPHHRPMVQQELEECDNSPEGERMLTRINHSGLISHQVNVSSYQWLFNGPRQENDASTICLRHDVDACVWQPKLNPTSSEQTNRQPLLCDHVATFDALGYVQASKQNRKFITSPSDYSYSVVCECARNVFMYFPDRQPDAKHALQSIFTLPTTSASIDSTVLGVAALPKRRVFVLTEEQLLLLSVCD